jgi:hypothetical protein
LTLVGHVDGLSRYAVAGWAADTESPERAVGITICVNGQNIAQVTANLPREDLRRIGNFGSGKHGFSFAFDPRIAEESQVLVKYSETADTLPNGVAKIPAESPQFIAPELTPSRLKPLLLTAHARSGSTIFMKILADHPKISVVNLPPYEVKLLEYYSAVYRVLTSRGDREHSSTPENLESNTFFVGFNPFFDISCLRAFKSPDTMYDYFERTASDILKRPIRETIEGFYEKITEDLGKKSSLYFAEKSDIFSRSRIISRKIFPDLHEIVLVRDLRDVLCSSRSFFKQPERAVAPIKEYADKILNLYRENNDDIIFIRYEDIIARGGVGVLDKVSEYLRIDAFTELSKEEAAKTFHGHGTSASPEASIGRWRNELTDEERKFFESELTDFFKSFGYEIA